MAVQRPIVVCALLVAATLTPRFGSAGVRAAAEQRYTSARYGYSLRLPATWSSAAGAGQVDRQFRTPDGATTFTVQVSGGTMSPSTTSAIAARVVHTVLGVSPAAHIAGSASTPALAGGFAAQFEARATVGTAHRYAVARVVTYDGYVFLFVGSGPTLPTIAVDGPAYALNGILSSLVLTPVRTHVETPGTHFGIYYPRNWSAFHYPALGKVVEHGPAGAVIFADYGRAAANAIDLRLLLLQNAVLMGKMVGRPRFVPDPTTPPLQVDGHLVQAVQVLIVDPSGRKLTAIVADASFNGFNYVFGGAAPAGSAAERAVIDTITSATMRPPALPADTGAFSTYTNAAHRYALQVPSAWIASEHGSTVDAVFSARTGDLTLVLQTRTGTVGAVLDSLTAAQKGATQKVTAIGTTLGPLQAQERIVTRTIVPGLVQESHVIAAASAGIVYVVSWSFYTSMPDVKALQALAHRATATFHVG